MGGDGSVPDPCLTDRRDGARTPVLVDAEIDDVPAAAPTALPAGRRSRRALVYLGLCLVLIGLNLRTVFSSFAAVLPEVTSDAGLPGWAVVVLTTVPVTLLGVFAPLAPVLARRFGAERVLLGAMAVLTAGLLLRPRTLAGWCRGRPPPCAPGRERPHAVPPSPSATCCSRGW